VGLLRRGAALIATLGLAACSPDIESGAYYCGLEEACAPGLVCDVPSHVCVTAAEATPFACSEGADLPVPSCGPDSLGSHGCIGTAATVDTIALTTTAGCTTHVAVQLSYPIAFMPLALTVHDAGGAIVGTAAGCHGEHGGLTDACVDFVGAPGATYTFDVAAAPGAPTCGGACAFNSFDLAVLIQRP
jgi:hypothetical protein